MAFDDGHRGLYHCVNPGGVTPFFLACSLRQRLRRGRVIPVEWGQLGLPAPRPLWSALGTRREIKMPPLEEAMEIWLKKYCSRIHRGAVFSSKDIDGPTLRRITGEISRVFSEGARC